MFPVLYFTRYFVVWTNFAVCTNISSERKRKKIWLRLILIVLKNSLSKSITIKEFQKFDAREQLENKNTTRSFTVETSRKSSGESIGKYSQSFIFGPTSFKKERTRQRKDTGADKERKEKSSKNGGDGDSFELENWEPAAICENLKS